MGDPTWLEILVRAVAGEAHEQPTEGVVAVRLDDDDADLTRFRVWKHADRWRVEDEDGRPRCIQDDRFTYDFAHDRDEPYRTERARGDASDDSVVDFLRRPEPTDWRPDDDDYSRLASPPRRTVHLGRDAWEVALEPPRHKSGELVRVLDAVDGRLLEERNTVHGPLARWEEMHELDDLPAEIFTWDGPYAAVYAFGEDDVPEELRDEVERERRASETFLAALELDDLVLTGTGEASAYVEAGGYAMVHWSADAGFRLQRHPVDAPVDEDDDDLGDRAERSVWADDRWRWTLVTHAVDARSRPALVEQLHSRTRALSDTAHP